jgi:hypothetical protein
MSESSESGESGESGEYYIIATPSGFGQRQVSYAIATSQEVVRDYYDKRGPKHGIVDVRVYGPLKLNDFETNFGDGKTMIRFLFPE